MVSFTSSTRFCCPARAQPATKLRQKQQKTSGLSGVFFVGHVQMALELSEQRRMKYQRKLSVVRGGMAVDRFLAPIAKCRRGFLVSTSNITFLNPAGRKYIDSSVGRQLVECHLPIAPSVRYAVLQSCTMQEELKISRRIEKRHKNRRPHFLVCPKPPNNEITLVFSPKTNKKYGARN